VFSARPVFTDFPPYWRTRAKTTAQLYAMDFLKAFSPELSRVHRCSVRVPFLLLNISIQRREVAKQARCHDNFSL
jgi:hypothetical protein